MAAKVIEIADGIVEELNKECLSFGVVAERSYEPVYEVPEMEKLHVTVVPSTLTREIETRQVDKTDYEVDLVVQKREVVRSKLDDLVGYVEEIADLFSKLQVASARCIGIENDPVFSEDHLRELRQFTSVLTLRFRAWR